MNDFCFNSEYIVSRKTSIQDQTGQQKDTWLTIGTYNGEQPTKPRTYKQGQGYSPEIETSTTSLIYNIRLDPKTVKTIGKPKEGDMIRENKGIFRNFLVSKVTPTLDPFCQDYIWFYKLECTQSVTTSYKTV
jgi:hypothetical protein